MTMTLVELFEALPTRFNAPVAVGLKKAIRRYISGTQSGVWASEIIDGEARVIAGGVADPHTSFTASGDIWIAVAEVRRDAMKAFSPAKLDVTGDLMPAMMVPELFRAPEA